ncbi:MAG: carboxypeptidase-like regulatory domain-containing protein [Candidatus Wallbacteria bacterium]|nr:carboxypeptidase-like regulatory domain-containing protein [Candidatus Wallbacteria bacterium]
MKQRRLKALYAVFCSALLLSGCGGGGGGGGGGIIVPPPAQQFGFVQIKAVYPPNNVPSKTPGSDPVMTVASIYMIAGTTEAVAAPLRVSYMDSESQPYGQTFTVGGKTYTFAGMGIFDFTDRSGTIKALVGENLTLMMAMKDESGATVRSGIVGGISVQKNITNAPATVEVYEGSTPPLAVLARYGVSAADFTQTQVAPIAAIPTTVSSIVKYEPVIIPDQPQDPEPPVEDPWLLPPVLNVTRNSASVESLIVYTNELLEFSIAAQAGYAGLGEISYILDGTEETLAVYEPRAMVMAEILALSPLPAGQHTLEIILKAFGQDGVTAIHTVTGTVLIATEEYPWPAPVLTVNSGGYPAETLVVNEGGSVQLAISASAEYPGLGVVDHLLNGASSGQYTSSSMDTLLLDSWTEQFDLPGVYTMEVKLYAYEEDGVTVRHTVTQMVTVTVNDYNVLQGTITDTSTGLPVADAGVFLSGTEYVTNTDATGFYQFAGIPAGTYTIVVKRDDYVIQTIENVVVN